MTKLHYDQDADLNLLKGKAIAIMGYGSQGHAHALNLRDSGVKDIAVALRKGSQGVAKAEGEKLKVMEVAEAAKIITGNADPNAKIIFGAIIDENMKDEVRVTVIATGFDNREGITLPSLSKSAYSSAAPVSRPSLFAGASIFRSDRKERDEKNAPPLAKKVVKKAEEADESSDEELEIPAFIRKKMM